MKIQRLKQKIEERGRESSEREDILLAVLEHLQW